MNNDILDWWHELSLRGEVKTGLMINEHNRSVYLTVVWLLGAIGLISLGGVIYLADLSREMPHALIAFGSAAVGALGGLFAHGK